MRQPLHYRKVPSQRLHLKEVWWILHIQTLCTWPKENAKAKAQLSPMPTKISRTIEIRHGAHRHVVMSFLGTPSCWVTAHIIHCQIPHWIQIVDFVLRQYRPSQLRLSTRDTARFLRIEVMDETSNKKPWNCYNWGCLCHTSSEVARVLSKSIFKHLQASGSCDSRNTSLSSMKPVSYLNWERTSAVPQSSEG